MDEAGTSKPEPVTVVAGVIVNADKDWKRLEDYLLGVRDAYIPPEQREGFVFHAMDVSAGNKVYADEEVWPVERRFNFIKEMLYARPLLGFSVALGFCRREANEAAQDNVLFRHLMAYFQCVCACEMFMREYADPDEVALLTAEDTPAAKKHLKGTHAELTSPTSRFAKQDGFFPIRHIVDTVHFAEKSQSPLLQFADACAFAFRRELSGYSGGADYLECLRGPVAEPLMITKDEMVGNRLLASTEPMDVRLDKGLGAR